MRDFLIVLVHVLTTVVMRWTMRIIKSRIPNASSLNHCQFDQFGIRQAQAVESN
jgi:hypothetical protein